MEAVLSTSEIARLSYPREALQDIMNDLRGLPPKGFDFTTFTSLPPSVRSAFTQQLSGLGPHEALQVACEYRASRESRKLRIKLSKSLFRKHGTCAVGTTYVQSVKNANVSGDLIQTQIIIHATPND